MTSEIKLRARLLARLTWIAERLPNGLLYRLVEDAQFYDWNSRKKSRASSRLSRYK